MIKGCMIYFVIVYRIGVRDKKKKSVKIYECCHGFQREGDSIGCPKGRGFSEWCYDILCMHAHVHCMSRKLKRITYIFI